jgi:glycosyltransferase involved in cell wall biosynthesis
MSVRIASGRVRVAFFNPIFPHYRGALLRELQSSSTAEFAFFADTHAAASRIPTLDLSKLPQFKRTPVVWLPFGILWQAGLVTAALSGEYDTYIIHGDAHWASSWIGAALARLRGKRVLLWTHGWTRPDRGIRKLTRAAFYRLAHGLLLYGDRARDIGIAQGFAPGRLFVMYNSLDFEAQQRHRESITDMDSFALRQELFGSHRTPVLLANARLTERKRFDLLIDAARLLTNAGQPVNLLIVGDGPERRRLEAQAKSEGVRAVFVGACYDEQQVARYFACANVTVSPGDVGLTCMHSLAYGTPVITHDDANDQMPEWEAIVPGSTGALFKKGSAQDLARTIAQWTGQSWPDDGVRVRCIAAIRDRYHPCVQRQRIEAAVTGEVQPAPRTLPA